MIFGGYKGNDVLLSQALVVTWVVNNGDKDSEVVTRAESWETELEKFLLQVQVEAEERGLRLSFSTDISLEKELNKSTNTDARIVALSYLFMFIYASVALGGVLPGFGKNSFVKSKFSLGLFGIFVVLLSVAASVGFFSFLGVKATLIIAEVIPFLVLAVGVDNIFLITHELETVNSSHPNESVEERVSRAVGHIGPSILLSAFCETLTFALGATVSMPAVRNFALYSAGAVFVNFILQLTMFVSAITLDQKRIESNRFDLIPCLRSRKSKGLSQESFSSITARALASPGVFEKVNEPTFSKLIKRHYAPYILKANIKPVIMTIFFAFFAIGLSLFPKLELGLDQRIAVPSDSYLVNYFDDFYSFFNVAWNVDMSGMPEGEEFMTYFNAWIEAPSDPCPLGGKAPYSAEVSVEYGNSAIQASKFRSMHVPLRSQDDFINAYLSARRIAKSIEEASGINTFAYSPFYIFFAQTEDVLKVLCQDDHLGRPKNGTEIPTYLINSQPIHTLTVLEKSETELHIAGFSDYRNALLLVATIGGGGISLAVAENNTPQRFLDDRVAAGEFLGSNYTQDAMSDRRYTSQCFGVTVSPLGDYIAFLHSIVPDAQLRYPIPSGLRAFVSFLVLGGSSTTNSADAHAPRLQPELVAVVPPATQYSPIVTWWKVQAIIGSLRQKLRPAFTEATIKLFHERGNIPAEKQLFSSAEEDITGGVNKNGGQWTLVQTVGFDMFLAAPPLDSVRVYHHYKPQVTSYPRVFIERLAYSVLAFLAASEDEDYGGELVGLDKALVLAYSQVLVSSPKHRGNTKVRSVVARVFAKYGLLASESEPLESVPAESTTLAVRGEGFEETFNFFKAASKEHSNGTKDGASSSDLYAIKSEGRGHSWRICATTLLPLLRYDGMTCTGCSRPQITRDESNPAYDGIILKSVLEAVDICIYCGCKFVNN
ncbi:hypothetical protein DV451_002188 [Geotrichum candidum]|uniref:SSD domain-containing protein n=1 Tax=Geotrichum candidum TaxID=1173061 RepID=A0A9P5G588_GEOCN|nr:hypothetical protein DV451_002188 [Geotrichum candidum]